MVSRFKGLLNERKERRETEIVTTFVDKRNLIISIIKAREKKGCVCVFSLPIFVSQETLFFK